MVLKNFYAGQGTDSTGVPTDLITANITMLLSVYNSAPTFGIHVSSGPINIMYSMITVATGEVKKNPLLRNLEHLENPSTNLLRNLEHLNC